MEEYESHKHYQHYWADRIPKSPTDFREMYDKLIADGSSATLAIKVLLNQNASIDECAAIFSLEHEVEIGDAKRFIENVASE